MTGGERVRIGDVLDTGQPAWRWRNTNAHSKHANRFRTLFGTARQPMPPEIAKAKHYFRELNRVADKADMLLPEFAEATVDLAIDGTTSGQRW